MLDIEMDSCAVPFCATLLLIGLLVPLRPAVRTGVVIDAGTLVPIAGAEVALIGYRGTARTDRSGRFRWTPPPPLPVTVIVILPDCRVARPIRLLEWDGAKDVFLMAESAHTESVSIAGVAPGIDLAPGESTTVLPSADLDLRGPATLSQALENVPGVSFISEGQGAVPAIRGLARGRSLILLDGSRVSTERRAGPNAAFLDPADIERVEIARGPGSVAYGSDAFGGVIAVRTRRPSQEPRLQARVSATLGAGVPERRGDVEVSAGGILVALRGREFDDYRSPGGTVPNSGWSDGGIRALWEHDTGRRRWSAGWQSDLGRGIGRPRSDVATLRTTTPYENSHRLAASYDERTAGWFSNVRVAALFALAADRTEQERLATAKQPRSVSRADVSSREAQLRVTGDGFSVVKLQVGADFQARYGLEALDTALAYNLAGAVVATQTNHSIDSASQAPGGVFAQTKARSPAGCGSRPGCAPIPCEASTRAATSETVTSGTGPSPGSSARRSRRRGRSPSRPRLRGGFAIPRCRIGSTAARWAVASSKAIPTSNPRRAGRSISPPAGSPVPSGCPSPATTTALPISSSATRPTAANFFFRNRGAARIRGAEFEAEAGLPHGVAMALAAQVATGRDADNGRPLDDIPARSIAVIVRHSAGRTVTSYLRVAAVSRHDAAGPTEVPTPGFAMIDAGAVWRPFARLAVRGTVRNLLDASMSSSAGPRWVYAPGRNGLITLVVGF